MMRFVALLRGINVSGQKQIRMVDLQKSCEGLGLKDMRSYLQSGNVGRAGGFGRPGGLLYCPHGYGRTKLNNGFFERALGVSATTRNWRTVLALKDLCTRQ